MSKTLLQSSRELGDAVNELILQYCYTLKIDKMLIFLTKLITRIKYK